ncbi:Rieske 2Fe-2S domain-containing protein [Chromobacterium vaccinii]|uniref:Rieske (2Fe-2S) protein n=1 Tax=Chromobacterium vaccinii TaxID=1108595 RepID=UPI001E626883|nr:Rieske 2Fe-2S domain-containing protein [Chromobacterium vaccinii]MCD4484932.1 Rieske 2Fe-2S domain-containing protein [Chromobacterium vaccinii]MCD4498652.1 Rieske 2Fe-2S domain-containing protein [Chromobacterium vaccinii]
MAAPQALLICRSSDLEDGGLARRFEIAQADGDPLPAFVIRYRGRVYGYLNRCRHIPVELDLQDGNLFDLSGHYLICSMHGARYRPDNGYCTWGPCRGQSLTALDIVEEDSQVWLNVMPA